MKTVEQIVDEVAISIGYIYYHNPAMYGGTADGVNLLLVTYHRLFAFITDDDDRMQNVYWKVLADEDCDANNFPGRYRVEHPDASDDEVTAYVVRQWRKISDLLGVPIPHEQLKAEFSGNQPETGRN